MYIFNGWTGGYEGYSPSTSEGMIAGFSSLSTAFAFTYGIEGLVWVGNSQEVWYNNYNTYTTSSNGAGNLPSTINPSFGIYQQSDSTSVTFQWLRTRAYPPSGTMPSVSFGSIATNPSIAPFPVAVSPNQITIPIGGNYTFTTQCYNNGTALSLPVGQVFNGYFFVNYTSLNTGFQKTLIGKIAVKAV